MPTGKHWTREEAKEIVEDLGYKFVDFYVKEKAKVVFIDANGYIHDILLKSLSKRKTLSFVGRHNPYSLKNISLYLEINNKSFKLLEDNVYSRNNKKLFFSCDVCSEEFDSTWADVSQGVGCPYCSGQRVGRFNNLEYLRPDLIEDWDFRKNEFLPSEIVCFSTKRAFWLCNKCEHEWNTKIYKRTHSNRGCPACSGKVVTDKNRLSILFPEISSEWHPSKNGELTPNDVSFGSTKKFWWICGSGHEWKTTINSRASLGNGCPKCKNSRGENKISSFLKEFNITHIPEYKFKNCVHKKELPFDFAIFDPDGYLNCLVEYHGIQHYEPIEFFGGEKSFRELQIRDNIKKKFCEDNNIPLKIIPYWDYDNIEKILQDYLF